MCRRLWGMAALPVYKWKYYNIRELIDLGLTTEQRGRGRRHGEISTSPAMPRYVRESAQEMVLNWFQPATCEDDEEATDGPGGLLPAPPTPRRRWPAPVWTTTT